MSEKQPSSKQPSSQTTQQAPRQRVVAEMLPPEHQHYIRGKTLLRNKDYDGALSEFQRAIELNRNFALYHHYLGMTLVELGSTEIASNALIISLKLDPKHSVSNLSNYTLSMMSLRQAEISGDEAQYSNALQYAENAIRLSNDIGHNMKPAYMLKAGSLLGLKRYSDVIVTCKKALKIVDHRYSAMEGKKELVSLWSQAAKFLQDPREIIDSISQITSDAWNEFSTQAHLEFLFAYAVALIKSNNFDKAYEVLKEHNAIRLCKTLEEYNTLAQIYNDCGELQDALEATQAAHDLNPTEDSWYNLATIYSRMENTEMTRFSLEGSLELNPLNAKAHNLLGKIHYAAEEYQKATSCFERALELAPADKSIGVSLVDALWEVASAPENPKALECIEKLIPLYTKFKSENLSIVRKLKADLLFQKGEVSEALTEYKASLKIKDDAHCHYQVGVILLGQGKSINATTAFESGIKTATSNNSKTQKKISIETRLEREIESFSKIISAKGPGKDQESNERAHLCFGKALANLGYHDKAIEVYRMVTASPTAFEAIGDSLDKLGQKLEAYKSYDFAKALDKKVQILEQLTPSNDIAEELLSYYAETIAICEKEGKIRQTSSLYPKLSQLYANLGDRESDEMESIDNYHKAIKAMESNTKGKDNIQNLHRKISEKYQALGDKQTHNPENALDYYNKALNELQLSGAEFKNTKSLILKIGKAHESLGDRASNSDEGSYNDAINNYQKALSVLEKAGESKPTLVLIHSKIGEGHEALGDLALHTPEDALRCYGRAMHEFQLGLTSSDKIQRLSLKLDKSHERIGDIAAEDKLSSYEEALALYDQNNGDSADIKGIHLKMGNTYNSLSAISGNPSDYTKAIDHYNLSEVSDPHLLADIWHRYGDALLHTQSQENANAAYEKALGYEPGRVIPGYQQAEPALPEKILSDTPEAIVEPLISPCIQSGEPPQSAAVLYPPLPLLPSMECT
ncbi:MAG: tetratricopeptide repeat protein [Pseudomonadota bacterium]